MSSERQGAAAGSLQLAAARCLGAFRSYEITMTRTKKKKINVANGIVLTGAAVEINTALTTKAQWDRFSGLFFLKSKQKLALIPSFLMSRLRVG